MQESSVPRQEPSLSRHESLTTLGTASCNEKVCKSPTLCSPQSASLPTSSAVESSNVDALKSPKPVVPLSNKQSDNVPIFVSHVPTGLTSPVALRSVSNAFGKGTKDKKTYPSFIVDSHRNSPVTTEFKKDKCHNCITKKQIGKLNTQSSPQSQTYFPSIAERTRSQSSRCNHDALPIPKVNKQAERELSKLEITMNSPSKRVTKIQLDQDHETIRKQTGNRVKRDSGKRKRAQRQPRSDPKRKRYTASTYHHHHEAEYSISDKSFDQSIQLLARASNSYGSNKQSNESEDKENGRNLNKHARGVDKVKADFDKSEGELDSSNEYRSEGELERSNDGEIPDETKEIFNENGVHLDRNGDDKDSQVECKEDGGEDGVIETRSKILEAEHSGRLDKRKEDYNGKCERQIDKEQIREEVKNSQEGKDEEKFSENESKVENKEQKLEDKNKMESDEIDKVENDFDKKLEEGKNKGEIREEEREKDEKMLEINDRGS